MSTKLSAVPRLLPSAALSPALLGEAGGPGRTSASTAQTYVLGNAGRCAERPTLLTLLSDNSGSMYGGNDPVGNRYTEAAYACQQVARRCRCGKCAVSILHFDTPTSCDVDPTPLRTGMKPITAGLAVPSDGAGISSLTPSLRAAGKIAADHADHHKVLIVFSDFELFDSNLLGLYADLGAYPGQVHAVVMRSTPPAALTVHPDITVTQVGPADPQGAVARALFDSLTTHRPGRRLAGQKRHRS